nr:helix-turn-helix domain-containing protein [uncultured Mucilaginibacter sp.]
MVTIQTYQPKLLSAFIKSFWYLEVGDAHPYDEDILPDGHTEIIFHLSGNDAKRKERSGVWVPEPDCFIAAQTLTSYKLHLSAGAKLYGIRFYPHTLYMLLGVPMDELKSGTVQLTDVLPAMPFWNCIANTPGNTFQNLERYLTQSFAGRVANHSGFNYVAHSVGTILQANGMVKVKGLVADCGISAKYHDTLFKKFTGITPRVLSSMVRLNNFISYSNKHPDKTYTECAYATGYYDQSHLIKAFQQFGTSSPHKYFEGNTHIGERFAFL